MVEQIQTSTGIDGFIGGIPKGTALGIVGPSASGKTILTVQMAYDVMLAESANSVFIDTEGNGHVHEPWVDNFNSEFDAEVQYIECEYDDNSGKIEKFDIEDDEADHYMYVIDVRHMPAILDMVGREEDIEVSSNGKITLTPTPQWSNDIFDSPIGDFVLENTVKYLGIDSVTNPLTEFEGGQQNLPARSKATNLLMLQVQKLAQKTDLAVTTIHHETFNPQNSFDKASEKGGKAIGYNHKYMIHLQNETTSRTPKAKKRPDHVRACWIIRHPSKKEWSDFKEIELDSSGFKEYER